jgi:hypothetical protein
MALSSEKKGEPRDVFISYSRRDLKFARRLDNGLNHNFTTWFDKDDVFPAGKFWEDIEAGIEEAGAFISILSLASIESEPCTRELNYAHECKKKIICVNFSSKKDIPHMREILKLGGRDWVNDLDWIDADPLDRMLNKVIEALLTDQDDWRQSGQWLRMATEWSKDRKLNSGLLLHGKELKKAEQWKKRTDEFRHRGIDKRPQPLPIHIEFIRASRRSANHLLAILATIILVIFILVSSIGGVIYRVNNPDPTLVTNLNNEGTGSLRWALANASAGSTITFASGLKGVIQITHSDIEITKNLTIIGPGTDALTISSPNNQKIHLNPNTSVAISNLSFRNFRLKSNGAIFNQGTLTLKNVNISGNTDITAPNYSVVGTSLQTSDGGSLYNEATLTLINSKVLDNTVTAQGPAFGGGIYNAGILSLIHSVVSGNHLSCHLDCIGGGILNGGKSRIINTVSLTIDDSVVSNNTVTATTIAAGGAIFNNAGSTLSLVRSTLAHNQLLAGNECLGGGLFSTGAATVTASTISDNTISQKSCGQGAGGGVFNDQPGKLTLTNSTIGENAANDGGGIFNQRKNSQLTILFCTISGNTDHKGAGIVVDSGTTIEEKIGDSIVAHNLSGSRESDIAGNLTSLGYNLIQQSITPSSFVTASTDILNIDPKLATELQNNGGLTQSFALLYRSPAIGKIPLTICHSYGITTDQGGMKRPGNNKLNCDIGSYESQN